MSRPITLPLTPPTPTPSTVSILSSTSPQESLLNSEQRNAGNHIEEVEVEWINSHLQNEGVEPEEPVLTNKSAEPRTSKKRQAGDTGEISAQECVTRAKRRCYGSEVSAQEDLDLSRRCDYTVEESMEPMTSSSIV